MDTGYDGLGLGLGNLARLSAAETRSISAENPTGTRVPADRRQRAREPSRAGAGTGLEGLALDQPAG